jgi:DNA-binding response OmpR family regulator
VADLILDCAAQEVTRDGRTIDLSRTEYVLLEALMRNAGRVQSRQSLFGAVWGEHRRVENNTLDAFIRLLRKKIDEPYSAQLIQTVRGFGYRMDRP